MPTFTPPTTYQQAFGPTVGLNRYYTYTRGVAVLVSGTTVTEDRYPFQGDLDDFDFVYLGGYRHSISAAEAVTLTNAGYGSSIT